MSYGEYAPGPNERVIQYHVGENVSQQYDVGTRQWRAAPDWLGREGPASTSASPPSRAPIYLANVFDVGIFRDTLAPSLALHSGLALVAWGAGRRYDDPEARDWLWPAGQLVNAWWSAVGRRLARGEAPALVARTISWPEGLLLAGVTAWGGRFLYRISSRDARGAKRESVKTEEGYWDKALLNTFLPEALLQAVIALPLAAPFRHQGGVMAGYHPAIQSLAVGVLTAGLALEVLADRQQAAHRAQGDASVLKEGVWSIVRHPNYLGDALIHASFPLLLFGSDMLAPVVLLAPLANYLFLRHVGGERSRAERAGRRAEDPVRDQQEAAYEREKNFFWPAVAEAANPWVWTVLGAGLGGALLERGLRTLLTE